MKLPISISIITLNEEQNLARCLNSVADLASEIVVIDSGSTDRTREVAERYGAIFEYRKWPGHVNQKNHALSRCSQPWVLAIDADEALSEELQKALIEMFSSDSHTADGYWINRKTFYLGDWIRHAWYPEWRLRLVRRELGHWEGVDPHDRMKEPKTTDKLSGDMLHYSYKDLEDHLSRTIKYARIGADAKIRKGGKFQWHKLAFSPWMRFVKTLLIRQAWRDGWRGWIIAFSSMLTCFSKYAFMYEQERAGAWPEHEKGVIFSDGNRLITIARPFGEDAALRNYILNMETRFFSPEAQSFKNDHAATVIALPIGGTTFVIKRYNPVSWIKDWRRAVRKSRARKTWENAVHLKNIGIHTVEPVALIERKLGPLCLRASFISLFEGGNNAQDYFRNPEIADDEKRKAARQIIQSLQTMHSAGTVHGDTKDTNILVDGQRIKWLDLDALSTGLPRAVRRTRIRKDWRLLLYNWKNYPRVQRLFIDELQLQMNHTELYRILNELIRHRKKKLGSEIDDPDHQFSQSNPHGPDVIIRLLHCAGIFVTDSCFQDNSKASIPQRSDNSPIKSLDICLAEFEKKDPEKREYLLKRIGEEIGHFHGCGFVHGYLSLKNLFISYEESPPRFFFSDIAKVTHYKKTSSALGLDDLARFDQDARRLLSRTDRMRIYSGYSSVIAGNSGGVDLLATVEGRTGKIGRIER